MTRRIPVWLTLVPLLAALLLYWLLWSGWASDFRVVIQGWLPKNTPEISGFPYRLEADVANPAFAGGDVVKLMAKAVRARINRGPWQPELTVISSESPIFSALASPLLKIDIAGKTALTSIHITEGRLQRVSTVIEAATVRFGFRSLALAADGLELHLRERISARNTPAAATPSPRAQLVIAGTRLRFANSDAVTFAADIVATGAARLTAYDAWATTGTIEITSLTLADASGEVARVRATLVPVGRTSLRYAGTIETICPASVIAAFNGLPAPSERRLRAPARLAFEGKAGLVTLTGIPENLAARATRSQLPPCPALRGVG